MTTARAALLAFAFLVTGCAEQWVKSENVERVLVTKIETDFAAQFCSALVGRPLRGCAVRMRDTNTGEMNCVVVVAPNDSTAIVHEAGGHCMGYDH